MAEHPTPTTSDADETPRVVTPRPEEASAVLDLADRAGAADGHPPLSDQTRVLLARGGQLWWGATRGPDGAIDGAAVLVPEGAAAVLELVVDPTARRTGRGTVLADAAAAAVRDLAREETTSVWAHGMLPGAVRLARRHGLEPVRELRRMRLSHAALAALPEVRLADGVALRGFVPGQDEQAWLDVNAAAFADHPEQGSLTRADLEDRMAEDWFDADGLLLAAREADGRLLGFHWTKVEPDAGADGPRVGEVYAVGVSPDAQGLGLGRALTLAGLHRMAEQGVDVVDLYVDADNTAAVALYASLGFELFAADAQYRRP